MLEALVVTSMLVTTQPTPEADRTSQPDCAVRPIGTIVMDYPTVEMLNLLDCHRLVSDVVPVKGKSPTPNV